MSSSHGRAPEGPRSTRTEDAGAADAHIELPAAEPAIEAPLALRWDGATPPPLPVIEDATVRCHACDSTIDGEPAGHGLLVFPRGDDVMREEPPLCERCALAIGMTALWGFAEDEEEG